MAAPKAVKTFAIPTPPAKTTGAFAWEATLADLLQIPYSKDVKAFFDAWTTADQSKASNNPFNITLDPLGTATGNLAGNPDAVKNFPTALTGLQATAKFLQDRTPDIITALGKGDFAGASQAIQSAGWAPSDPTYGASIYKNFQTGTYNPGNNVPTTLSPKEKAQVAVIAETDKATAEAGSQPYLSATEQLAEAKVPEQIAVSESVASAKAEAHIQDGTQWVVQQTNKLGDVIGFTYSTGANAPKNVLLINGEPATKNDLSQAWSAEYADTYAQFTGKQATPAQIASIVGSGVSVYGLRSQLASTSSFATSPIYKSSAAGLQGDAKTILGTNAPQSLVTQAIAENWDQATFEAKLRALPAYTSGPEFQTNVAQMTTTYQGIYGTPDSTAQQSIKEAAAAGWSTDQFASYLRTQPQYKTSLEYATNATSFLDAMGLLTGARPTLQPGKPATGGTPVPNSQIVPGAPTTLPSPLTLKPALAGAQGLAA